MFKFEWRSGLKYQYFSTCDSSDLLWNVFYLVSSYLRHSVMCFTIFFFTYFTPNESHISGSSITIRQSCVRIRNVSPVRRQFVVDSPCLFRPWYTTYSLNCFLLHLFRFLDFPVFLLFSVYQLNLFFKIHIVLSANVYKYT